MESTSLLSPTCTTFGSKWMLTMAELRHKRRKTAKRLKKAKSNNEKKILEESLCYIPIFDNEESDTPEVIVTTPTTSSS